MEVQYRRTTPPERPGAVYGTPRWTTIKRPRKRAYLSGTYYEKELTAWCTKVKEKHPDLVMRIVDAEGAIRRRYRPQTGWPDLPVFQGSKKNASHAK